MKTQAFVQTNNPATPSQATFPAASQAPMKTATGEGCQCAPCTCTICTCA